VADKAVSDDALVQAQLDRLNAMSPGRDILGLVRLRRLLAKMGNPERSLPPVFHVAGTNGKGSTCTYLRGAIAAAGMRAHVYTSPHLVRLNERIRVANHLIEDAALAQVLSDTLDAAGDEQITFFEATTAAAFLAFSRIPAEACVIEVGIGGRLDATNVIPSAIACGISQLGIDHQAFLGDTIEEIAAEKAGIVRAGVPLVTQAYGPSVKARIAEVAAAAGAPVFAQGKAWDATIVAGRLAYRDEFGTLDLPAPALAGPHQAGNAGLSIAMLRHQQTVPNDTKALSSALEGARWPARLAKLAPGPMTDLLPLGTDVWLDGAHNVAAMGVVMDFIRSKLQPGQRLEVVMALLNDKDADGVLACLSGIDATIRTVPIIGYDSRDPEALAAIARDAGLDARPAPDFQTALGEIAATGGEPLPLVLIIGSLYLAGQVLRFNREFPD
jgi:dihydrofolate synthase/folylpolyglutamate synthase